MNEPKEPTMNTCRILMMLAIVLLAACSQEDGAVPCEPEKAAETAAQPTETKTVEGTLKFYPQDVKSVEAWLGHEFMVGETPIRPTEAVPAETLRKMVGQTVKIEGVWNPGQKWKQPQPTDDEAYLQNPSFPEGEIVIRGSGIEAASVLEVDQ